MTEPTVSDPEVILFQSSPFGNLDALVQHNGQTVYFYLNQPPDKAPPQQPFGTRACWVRNLVQGPLVFDVRQIEAGLPPVFPRTIAANRQGQPIPDADDLEVVWFEEGNAAALFEHVNGEAKLLSVIPPWSGEQGFMGFSAACATEHPMCAPIPSQESFHRRIEKARDFWRTLREETDLIAKLHDQQMASYQHWLHETFPGAQVEPVQHFDINRDAFPPRRLLEYHVGEQLVLLTCGLSLCPQPNVELAVPDPQNRRRIELGFQWPLSQLDGDGIEKIRQLIAMYASMPWRYFRWMDTGHTCDFPQLLDGVKTARLSDENPGPSLENFRDDPVRLLWIVPVQE